MINASGDDIAKFATALGELKQNIDMDIEFVVTNDQIQLRDVKYLIKELYELYRREEKITEAKKNTKGVKK